MEPLLAAESSELGNKKEKFNMVPAILFLLAQYNQEQCCSLDCDSGLLVAAISFTSTN